ncbi:hypothetical protein K493DRAFT_295029 [Basidiobolus meristosporus CBS 931.73]|uniref:Uncharacterized protein n=1 Tax=Basidiobolus meristosporus CBS 931.73 TaxID=1314790 RepID=A0A1Y1ZDS8_9FUNG|nr:hypothetical protein K493DRAFT_295029 [Basidiobolus meristosporus CBS 931.73]|eukprot:ORY08440.1 hypothetical protein K493DRAFT_295029 [Basidiobolus meristosporus CBS 931.73]
MSQRVQYCYANLPTHRGDLLFKNSITWKSAPSGKAPEKKSNSACSDVTTNEETDTTTAKLTFGSITHLQEVQRRGAEQLVHLQRQRTIAIEKFCTHLQLDQTMPHYPVLQVAYLDYERMKNNEAEADKLTADQLNDLIKQAEEMSCNCNDSPSTG